jgi:hypothetical protein
MPKPCPRRAISVPMPPSPTTSSVRPSSAIGRSSPVLARVEVRGQVARQREQHREHVVGDRRAVDAAHVGEHDAVVVAQLGNRDVAVDAGAVRLHPRQVRRRTQELRRRVADVDSVGLARSRQRLLARQPDLEPKVRRDARDLLALAGLELAREVHERRVRVPALDRYPRVAQRADLALRRRGALRCADIRCGCPATERQKERGERH